jgi:hypothetical protein
MNRDVVLDPLVGRVLDGEHRVSYVDSKSQHAAPPPIAKGCECRTYADLLL